MRLVAAMADEECADSESCDQGNHREDEVKQIPFHHNTLKLTSHLLQVKLALDTSRTTIETLRNATIEEVGKSRFFAGTSLWLPFPVTHAVSCGQRTGPIVAGTDGCVFLSCSVSRKRHRGCTSKAAKARIRGRR